MINVEIVKFPLYGQVYWNGDRFIYTPNENFQGNDYYIYTAIVNGKKVIRTNYVNSDNLSPIVLNPSLTATIKNVNIIPINILASDSTVPFEYLNVVSVTGAENGKAYIQNNSIYYESNIYNFVESLSYEVSDKQYTTTGILTLSVIDGINQDEIPIPLKEILNRILQKARTIENLSGHWNQSYTVLTTFSADWNYVLNDIVPKFNFIQSASSDWNELYTIEEKMDSFVSTMTSNSAIWDTNYSDGIATYNLISPKAEQYEHFYNFLTSNSSYWSNGNDLSAVYYDFKNIFTDVVNTVSSTSALWDTTELNNLSSLYFDNWKEMYNYLIFKYVLFDTISNYVSSIETNLSSSSANYIDTYNNVSNNSATAWEIISEQKYYDFNNNYLFLESNSANWNIGDIFNGSLDNFNNLYNTLQENITSKWIPETFSKILTSDSILWNSVVNVLNNFSPNWFFDELRSSLVFYSNLTSNSANWENTFSILQSNSSNYDESRNNVISLSTKYLSGDFLTNLTVNNLTVSDSLTSAGSVNVLGNIERFDTEIVTTSAFIVYNESTNDAFTVDKLAGKKILTFKNPDSDRVLHINSTNDVGINMEYDVNQSLTVSGNISASGYIYPFLTDIINAYKSVSASYENTYSVLTSNSATTIADFISQMPVYENLINYINLSSSTINNLLTGSYGQYNELYNISFSQYLMNNKNYSILSSASANIGIDDDFRNKKYMYDALYNTYFNMQ